MKGITEGSLELSKRRSWAVMMALMCSKLTTMALSRPTIVEGYDSMGSRTRRSLAASPVRRIITGLPASTTSLSPSLSITSHVLFPLPFLLTCLLITLSVLILLNAHAQVLVVGISFAINRTTTYHCYHIIYSANLEKLRSLALFIKAELVSTSCDINSIVLTFLQGLFLIEKL